MSIKQINYDKLNARQKENYNFQQVSAVLADYGFVTFRLSDDWQGADFIAYHMGNKTFLKVQLKGRVYFSKKYKGKQLHITFRSKDGTWYLYPHDKILKKVLREKGIRKTSSWSKGGGYSFSYVTKELVKLLKPYIIRPTPRPIK